MSVVLAILALALLLAVLNRPRRRRRRLRRTARWLWTHPATVGLGLVFVVAWRWLGFNEALAAAVGYTSTVVVCRWLRRPQRPRRPRSTYRKQPIPRALRTATLKRDGFRCVYCGGVRRLTADHIVPESKGGPMTLDNLQTLCAPCNSSKGPNGPVVRSALQGVEYLAPDA